MIEFTPLWMMDLWRVAAWFVVHFLWVGTLVWMMATFARWLVGAMESDARYLFAVMSLLLLVMAAVASVALAAVSTWSSEFVPLRFAIETPLQEYILGTLAAIWAMGAFATGANVATGLWGVRRLRSLCQELHEGPIVEVYRQLQ